MSNPLHLKPAALLGDHTEANGPTGSNRIVEPHRLRRAVRKAYELGLIPRPARGEIMSHEDEVNQNKILAVIQATFGG